jgi:polyhydroxyalkanoate synthase subunit PhaC
LLNALFLSLMPFRLMHQKYINLLEHCAQQSTIDTFVRMEKWLFDYPDQPAAALAQFVEWFYQENQLIRGTLQIAGRRVELQHILQPVLNIYATQDHIVPPSASTALQRYIGSRDYAVHGVDTGHIGPYVSRRTQDNVPARIISWLQRPAQR